MYEEVISQYAQAEVVGSALQKRLEEKVAECNRLASRNEPGSSFLALQYAAGRNDEGRPVFSVQGKLQRAEMEVNPKPGRIAFTMKDERGEPKGATQLIKIENAAGDLPDYLAGSVVESVIEGTEFKA